MRKTFILALILLVPNTNSLIIDHNMVELYDDIPQTYIDDIKKMRLNVPGESHSYAYRRGLTLLYEVDPRFPAVAPDESATTPLAYREDALRTDRIFRNQYNQWSNQGTGESTWFTWKAWQSGATGYPTASANMIKNHITYSNANSQSIAAIGFGWCWDLQREINTANGLDTAFQVHWAGSSEGGPQGSLNWGLDAGDAPLTTNQVTMTTYIEATEEYRAHCLSNGFDTEVFFTTGPVDNSAYDTGESGYQRSLKHEFLRDYIKAHPDRILFDYADILAYNDLGQSNTVSWTDYSLASHTYSFIHPDNVKDRTGTRNDNVGHIGEMGAIRLAKALWVMLAIMDGWDAIPTGCESDNECDDGLFCNGEEICHLGTCASGTSPCNEDGIPCTTTCYESADTCNRPENSLCNDNNPCTEDTCISTGCRNAPLSGSCNDNVACTENDQCSEGNCRGIPNNNLCLSGFPECTSATCSTTGCGNYLPSGCNVGASVIISCDDSLSDGIATDSSGNGMDGTCTSCPDLAKGKIGNACRFDGATDFINLGSTDFGITSQFTIAFFFNMTINNAAFGEDVMIRREHYINPFSLGISSSNRLNAGTRSTIASPTYLAGTTTISPNIWYHAAFTFNNGQRALYLNGNLERTDTVTGTLTSKSSTYIGRTPDGPEYFNGVIDEVRIYPYALTQAEIQALLDPCGSCEQGFSCVAGTCCHYSEPSPGCDGCVSNTELLDYINRWKADSSDVGISSLLGSISAWKAGLC